MESNVLTKPADKARIGLNYSVNPEVPIHIDQRVDM